MKDFYLLFDDGVLMTRPEHQEGGWRGGEKANKNRHKNRLLSTSDKQDNFGGRDVSTAT